MSRFLVLFSVLVASVYCYQTSRLNWSVVSCVVNSPLTAFSSCQDVLVRNPMAADGYYYINNYDSVYFVAFSVYFKRTIPDAVYHVC